MRYINDHFPISFNYQLEIPQKRIFIFCVTHQKAISNWRLPIVFGEHKSISLFILFQWLRLDVLVFSFTNREENSTKQIEIF